MIRFSCRKDRADDNSAIMMRTAASGMVPNRSKWTKGDGACARGTQELRSWELGEKQRIRTSQISTEHKVQHEKAVFIVLESIAHVYDEGVVNLPNNHNDRE